MNRLLSCFTLLALCAQGVAAQELPPPGLYRVDSDASMQHKAYPGAPPALSAHRDGASGDETYRSGGDKPRVFKGSGPDTQCVKAGVVPLPPASTGGMCKVESTTRSAGVVIQKAACPSGKMTLTIRRLDAKTWEYLSEMDMSTGSPPSQDGTRTMLEMVARTAATQADRDKARQALAELSRREPGLRDGRAQAEAAMQEALAKAKTPEEVALARSALAAMQGRLPMKTSSRTTLTRVADSCPSQ